MADLPFWIALTIFIGSLIYLIYLMIAGVRMMKKHDKERQRDLAIFKSLTDPEEDE